jgi:anti-sigma B factor antagonist
MSLEITSSKDGSKTLVKVAGEVDVSNAPQLRQELEAALGEATPQVVVDFSEVPYIDSTGIGVLVGATHRAKEAGGSLTLSNPQKNVARVLSLLGVDKELVAGE